MTRPQEHLFVGVSRIINQLFVNNDLNKALEDVVEALGKADKVDGCYALINKGSNEEPHIFGNLQFYWVREGFPPPVVSEEGLPYSKFEAAFERLKSQHVFSMHRSKATGALKTLLKRDNIQSVLLVPIFADELFWGAIGFDDFNQEHNWGIEEEEALRSVGAAIGAIVIRDEYRMRLEQQVQSRTKELKESETRYRDVIDDLTELVVRWSVDGAVTFVNSSYCDYFQVNPKGFIGTNFFEHIATPDKLRIQQKLATLTPENPTVKDENRVQINGTTKWH